MVTRQFRARSGNVYEFEIEGKNPTDRELAFIRQSVMSQEMPQLDFTPSDMTVEQYEPPAPLSSPFLGPAPEPPEAPEQQPDISDQGPRPISKLSASVKSIGAGLSGFAARQADAISKNLPFLQGGGVPGIEAPFQFTEQPGDTAQNVVAGEYSYTYDAYIPRGEDDSFASRADTFSARDNNIYDAQGRRVVSPSAYMAIALRNSAQKDREGTTTIQDVLDTNVIEDPGVLGSYMLESVGEAFPYMATAMISFPALVISQAGQIADQRAANRAAAGGDPSTQNEDVALGMIGGLTIGQLERLGLRYLLNPGTTFGAALKRAAGSSVVEGGAEAAESVIQEVLSQAGTRDTDETVLGVDPSTLPIAAVGGLLGGAAPGFVGSLGASGIQRLSDRATAEEAALLESDASKAQLSAEIQQTQAEIDAEEAAILAEAEGLERPEGTPEPETVEDEIRESVRVLEIAAERAEESIPELPRRPRVKPADPAAPTTTQDVDKDVETAVTPNIESVIERAATELQAIVGNASISDADVLRKAAELVSLRATQEKVIDSDTISMQRASLQPETEAVAQRAGIDLEQMASDLPSFKSRTIQERDADLEQQGLMPTLVEGTPVIPDALQDAVNRASRNEPTSSLETLGINRLVAVYKGAEKALLDKIAKAKPADVPPLAEQLAGIQAGFIEASLLTKKALSEAGLNMRYAQIGFGRDATVADVMVRAKSVLKRDLTSKEKASIAARWGRRKKIELKLRKQRNKLRREAAQARRKIAKLQEKVEELQDLIRDARADRQKVTRQIRVALNKAERALQKSKDEAIKKEEEIVVAETGLRQAEVVTDRVIPEVTGIETLNNMSRSILASHDMGSVARQGGLVIARGGLMGIPARFARGYMTAARAYFGKTPRLNARRKQEALIERPLADSARQSGLHMGEVEGIGDGRTNVREEAFAQVLVAPDEGSRTILRNLSNMAGGSLQKSNNAFALPLNEIRVEAYDAGVRALAAVNGLDITPLESKVSQDLSEVNAIRDELLITDSASPRAKRLRRELINRQKKLAASKKELNKELNKVVDRRAMKSLAEDINSQSGRPTFKDVGPGVQRVLDQLFFAWRYSASKFSTPLRAIQLASAGNPIPNNLPFANKLNKALKSLEGEYGGLSEKDLGVLRTANTNILKFFMASGIISSASVGAAILTSGGTAEEAGEETLDALRRYVTPGQRDFLRNSGPGGARYDLGSGLGPTWGRLMFDLLNSEDEDRRDYINKASKLFWYKTTPGINTALNVWYGQDWSNKDIKPENANDVNATLDAINAATEMEILKRAFIGATVPITVQTAIDGYREYIDRYEQGLLPEQKDRFNQALKSIVIPTVGDVIGVPVFFDDEGVTRGR